MVLLRYVRTSLNFLFNVIYVYLFSFALFVCNCRYLLYANKEISILLVQDTFLVQHVTVPTRGDNILDLVLSSEQGMIEELKVIEHLANSDHNIVLFKAVVSTVNSLSVAAKYNYNLGD